MFCRRCKQVVRKLVFGFACGCAVLSGHAEEPPHNKWHFNQVQAQQVINSTSSAALTEIASLAGVIALVKSTNPSSGP